MSIYQNMMLTFSVIAISCLSTSGISQEIDDPDFDYLEPESISILYSLRNRTLEIFRMRGHAPTYTEAKRRMYGELNDAFSLYCSCPTYLTERRFDATTCGYIPRNDGDRAKRVEAEHIVPAFWIAHFNPQSTCWVAQQDCGSGRECCLANDPEFARAHNDLVNLYPAIGELNADRSNYLYGMLLGEARIYGACDFEVDSAAKVSEPREDMRGDIARVHFYMRDTYGLEFPAEVLDILSSWSEEDPISETEYERNERIQRAQGSSNPLILQQ